MSTIPACNAAITPDRQGGLRARPSRCGGSSKYQEILEKIKKSRDKLFFIFHDVNGAKQSFLVQVDLDQQFDDDEEGVLPNTCLYCVFFLVHPDDHDKPKPTKRFWIRWHKYNNKSKTLSPDVVLHSPLQTKLARKRSFIDFADWIDLTDPNVYIHGPFNFQSNEKNKPTYCVHQKDWNKLPGKDLGSNVIEEDKHNKKRVKLNDNKDGAIMGKKKFIVGNFYVKTPNNNDQDEETVTLFKIIEIKKDDSQEYCAICRSYEISKELDGCYAEIHNSSFSIPLTDLCDAPKSLMKTGSISTFVHCKPKENAPFHLAYFYDNKSLIYERSRRSLGTVFPEHRPCALEIFSGAGGMGLGLTLAGFRVKWAMDRDPFACATYKASEHGRNTQMFCESIECFLKKVREKRRGYPQIGEVDHLHASPPCQGFSTANRGGGLNDKMNNELSNSFTEAVQIFQPKTATMENVFGMLQEEHKKNYLHKIISDLLEMNYQVRCVLLNAKNYGDPQSRRRLIIFAAQKGYLLPSTPSMTHGQSIKNNGVLLPFNTSESAIGFIEKIEPDYDGAGIFKLSGDHNSTTIYNHRCSGMTIAPDDKKLVRNEPAWAITSSQRRIHYSKERFLSVRETACLQSFPVDYQFFGTQESMHRQIGNAVPVKFAKAIGRSVLVAHET